MNLSESYKKRLKDLSGILEESKNKNKYEYQIRNIGGDVYYKRKEGSKVWEFIDELDFVNNFNDNKFTSRSLSSTYQQLFWSTIDLLTFDNINKSAPPEKSRLAIIMLNILLVKLLP